MQLFQIKQILQEKCKLIPDNFTVIGVSGGADSLTLLHIMSKLGYRLVIAHFDHQLREGSAGDAEFVKNSAQNYGVEFVTGTDDVARYSREKDKTIEEAARILRYEFLLNIAKQFSAQAVAVAHHADDQVETILMHLIRGAGVAGLCGMKYLDTAIFPDQPVPIVRPLLGVWRKEIDLYCKENGIFPQDDLTNADIRFTRNRIRHLVLPVLVEGNPQFKEQLFQTGEIIKAENDLVSQLTHNYRKKIECRSTESGYCWQQNEFLETPLAIQRRLIFWVLKKFQNNSDNINFKMIDQVLSFIEQSSKSHKIKPVEGLEIYIHRGIIYFLTNEAVQKIDGYPRSESVLSIAEPGIYSLSEHWELVVAFLENPLEIDYSKAGEFECWLDADALLFPLRLHSIQPGDRIQLMGMSGHSKKVNDYLTDKHVPAQYRKNWPVIRSGGQVVWVAGSQPSEAVQISGATKKIIHLLIRKVDDPE